MYWAATSEKSTFHTIVVVSTIGGMGQVVPRKPQLAKNAA